MKFSKFAKAVKFSALTLHTLKTIHGKKIEPYKNVEAPDELNKPVKFRPTQNPISYTHLVFGGEYLSHLEFKFDFKFGPPKELLIYNKSQLIEWLRRAVLTKDDYKSKYIKVKKLEQSNITFIFDEKTWIADTIKGSRARLGYLKNSVIIPMKTRLPDLVLMNYPRPFLGHFLSKALHQYFKRNRSAMKFQNYFKFLDKINPDFFNYDVDWFRSEFKLTVKNTVILGALYMAFGIKRRLKA